MGNLGGNFPSSLSLTHPPLGNVEPVQGIFQRVNDVYLVRGHGTALHDVGF